MGPMGHMCPIPPEIERNGQVSRRSLAILMLLLLTGIQCLAGRRIVPSTDHLPLGDWTYDAMVSLASDGLVPGYAARLFEGDRLFNRMEMAQLVSLIIESSADTQLGSAQFVLIDHLVSEFNPELMYFHAGVVEKWKGRTTNISLPMSQEAFPLGFVKGTATDDTDNNTELAVPYHLSGFAHLAGQAFAIATLSDREKKFFQQERRDDGLTKVFARVIDGGTVWSVGREFLEWGPVYGGSMIVSDNSSAFNQARVSKEVEFGPIFGRVKITQFATSFQDNGARTYVFGRRYEKPFHHNFHLGFGEIAKTTFLPNPLFAIMPFYLYQHLFSKQDAQINTLYSTDLTYVANNGMQAYGDLVIDDMTSIKLLGKAGDRPRKIGFGGGIYFPKVFSDGRLSTFRAEYVTVDRLTYGATRPEVPQLAYTHGGDVIGSPTGPNAKAIYLRGERYFSDKFSAIAEYFNQWQSTPEDPQRGHMRSVSLMAAYDLTPSTSVALRVAPFRTALPGEPTESDTKYELRASFGF